MTRRQPPKADVTVELETSKQDITKPQIQTGLSQDLSNVAITVLDTISEDVVRMDHWDMFHSLTNKGILMIQQKPQRSWSVKLLAGMLLVHC